jgi:hypothetical protein
VKEYIPNFGPGWALTLPLFVAKILTSPVGGDELLVGGGVDIAGVLGTAPLVDSWNIVVATGLGVDTAATDCGVGPEDCDI